MRVLIDTNIIIDALESREPFFEKAKMVFYHNAIKTINMCITSKQLTDVYYITKKYTHDLDITKSVIDKLIKLFQILDLTAEDCVAGLGSSINDYEDSIIESIAYRNKCDFIITRNIKDFKNSRVRVIEPVDLLRIIEA